MMKCLKNILMLFVILALVYVAYEFSLFWEVYSIKNIDVSYKIGLEYYKKGNYIKSIKHLAGVYYGIFPEIKDVLCADKAALLNTFGMQEWANETIKNGLKENPDNKILNIMLGLKYLEDKNYLEAEKHIIRSATYKDVTSSTYVTLGDVYLKFDEPKRAVVAYDKSIELAPQLKTEREKIARIRSGYLWRAIAYLQAGEYENALNDCEFLIKQKLSSCISPDHVYYLMSISKTGLKDYAGALHDINKSISLSKFPYAKYQAQKSLIYLEQNDYKKAELFIKYALDSYPEDKYVNVVYALILLQEKEYQKALEHINNAYKSTKEPFLMMFKAQALYGLDKKKQAISFMKKLVKKYPYEEEFEKMLNKMLNGSNSLDIPYGTVVKFFER